VKRVIIIASISVIVAGAATTTLFALNQPKENIVTSPEAPQAPIESRVAQVAEPAPEASKTAPAPVQKAEEPTTPTNEDLIIQYGWDTDPYATSIRAMMQMVPQYFTDTERVTAFKYLDDVCTRNGQNISYCFNAMLTRGEDKVRTWINLGKYVGVDTSHYE
jgi:hypothetical protein